MNYSDNGLFGFYVISEPQNTGKVYKSSPFYVIMRLDYRSTISLPHVCLMYTVYAAAAGCDA